MNDDTINRLSASKSRRNEEVKARHLNVENSFNMSVTLPPKWTLGSRNTIKDDNRGRVQTELGPDVGCQKVADMICKASPKWTMQPRWKKDAGKADWVPGPGMYVVKSTVSLEKGWHMGSEERKGMPSEAPDSPAPNNYNPSIKAARPSEPIWSLHGKTNEHPPQQLNKTSGLWSAGASSAEFCLPRKLHDVRETDRRGGKARTPEWTIPARPESTLVPKGDAAKTPGVGTNTPVHTQNGKIARCPSWGFGTAKRFTEKKEMRPY